MIFDKFFEVGLIIIGLLWVADQILDSLIHFYDITIELQLKEMEMKEPEMPENVKHMYY